MRGVWWAWGTRVRVLSKGIVWSYMSCIMVYMSKSDLGSPPSLVKSSKFIGELWFQHFKMKLNLVYLLNPYPLPI